MHDGIVAVFTVQTRNFFFVQQVVDLPHLPLKNIQAHDCQVADSHQAE